MINWHRLLPKVIVIITLVVLGSGCAIPGLRDDSPVATDEELSVAISSPAAGQQIELGREIKIESTSIGNQGIARVELVVDGEVVWVDANADPQEETHFIVAQPWTPEVPGMHLIQVRAYNTSDEVAESKPLTVQVGAAAQAVAEASPTVTGEVDQAVTTSTPISAIEDAPTATLPTPSATPTELPTTPTPTTPLPTPSVTPTPGDFAPTGLEPEGRFAEIWEVVGAGESRLGYPVGPVQTDRDFARQYFEKGMMFWWDNPDESDYIWVIDSPESDLNSGVTWNRYVDQWESDEDDMFSCDQARSNGPKGPVRGFGKLWCDRPDLQTRLGNPQDGEGGSGGSPPFAHVQFYQGGLMLYNPLNNEVFVLFDQGDWQRFGYLQ